MRGNKPSADAGAPDSPAALATHRAIEAVWRIEAASVIAGVARLVRDVGLAEELAQDALVAALERWPASGVPDNPGAWLMTTAKNRARDRLRLDALHSRKHEQIGHELQALEADVEPDFVDALDAARQDDIGDDLLRLIFTACHPLLSTEARVALTLRLLGGLSTTEIARAFLASESTIAQRIVRAKRNLSAARVPFEVPGPAGARALASVLEVIYLIFNEGYSGHIGRVDTTRAMRRGAAPGPHPGAIGARRQRGARPGRADGAAGLAPGRPRRRPGPAGIVDGPGPRPLGSAADPARAGRAGARESLGGALGPYALQAALAACHARARRAEDTDWPRIVALYDALVQAMPSPVAELNRAVAVGMASARGRAGPGRRAGGRGRAGHYHWLPSVRGDLLAKLGRHARRARPSNAAGMTRNARERELLLARAAQMRDGPA